jgi:hypothetical protein
MRGSCDEPTRAQAPPTTNHRLARAARALARPMWGRMRWNHWRFSCLLRVSLLGPPPHYRLADHVLIHTHRNLGLHGNLQPVRPLPVPATLELRPRFGSLLSPNYRPLRPTPLGLAPSLLSSPELFKESTRKHLNASYEAITHIAHPYRTIFTLDRLVYRHRHRRRASRHSSTERLFIVLPPLLAFSLRTSSQGRGARGRDIPHPYLPHTRPGRLHARLHRPLQKHPSSPRLRALVSVDTRHPDRSKQRYRNHSWSCWSCLRPV